MSYGLGQFATGAPLMAFNTSQPIVPVSQIQPPAAVPVPIMMIAGVIPYDPTGPIPHKAPSYNSPTDPVHRAPSAQPPSTGPSVYISGSGQISSGPAKQQSFVSTDGETYVETGPEGSGGATFASLCKSYGGKMGTNCCKMTDGSTIGIQAGKVVTGVPCSAGGGLGSTALIAGAAIAAVVLMKFL